MCGEVRLGEDSECSKWRCEAGLVFGTVDRCSNELSLYLLAETLKLTVHVGEPWGYGTLGTGISLGWGWEQGALVRCSGSPAFESLFLFLALTLLICLGPAGALISSNLKEGALQSGEPLGFGL